MGICMSRSVPEGVKQWEFEYPFTEFKVNTVDIKVQMYNPDNYLAHPVESFFVCWHFLCALLLELSCVYISNVMTLLNWEGL